jgi:hypothetical protein
MAARGRLRCLGPVEIQLSLRLAVSQPITNRLHYSHSDFNKTTKQKIGPPADTFIVTSSGITAREPQQNPVLVFSITPISPQGEILLRRYTRRDGTRPLAHDVV